MFLFYAMIIGTFECPFQVTFACSVSTIEIQGKGVKYVQSWK